MEKNLMEEEIKGLQAEVEVQKAYIGYAEKLIGRLLWLFIIGMSFLILMMLANNGVFAQ